MVSTRSSSGTFLNGLISRTAATITPNDSTIATEFVVAEAVRNTPKRSRKDEPETQVKEEDSIPKTPKKSKKAKMLTASPRVKKSAPLHWKQVYDTIKIYRQNNVAAVDTMGCDTLADMTLSPPLIRYHILTALQLSSQTKDPVTAEAMKKLQSHEPGGLTPQTVVDMSDAVLDGYISKVGFHHRKTQYMKQTARILLDRYNGDIPRTLEDLLDLPGIGPKMAYLTLQSAWKDTQGIGVDTHVHRIAYRLGWTKEYKEPEVTRKELEDWLPKEYWGEVNHLLVGFGQSLCKPIGPGCLECPARELCPKRGVTLSPKKKRKQHE